MGEYSIEIKTSEEGYKNNIKIERTTDESFLTWKDILVSTIEALKGMGYFIDEETTLKIEDAIDY